MKSLYTLASGMSLFLSVLFIFPSCKKNDNLGPTSPPAIKYVVSTLAGSGTAGSADGAGAGASFNSPFGIVMDSNGNLYVGDYGNNKIRLINSAGMVSTFAGSGAAGDGNGAGATASFGGPTGLALDGNGNLFDADHDDNIIREIGMPGEKVTNFAGSEYPGAVNSSIPSIASFTGPIGITIDKAGNLFIADEGNNLIRTITSTGIVGTQAGSGAAGSTNGLGASASFNSPVGIVVDSNDNLYVTDFDNNLIRMITRGGVVTTLAGNGTAGSTDGIGLAASFNGPCGIAMDGKGNLYVSDENSGIIRMIAPGAIVTTIAGNDSARGNMNGIGKAATFNFPSGIAIDAHGILYIADYKNNQIRKITPQQQ